MLDIHWTSYVPQCWGWHSCCHQDVNCMVHSIDLVANLSANADSVCFLRTFCILNGPFVPALLRPPIPKPWEWHRVLKLVGNIILVILLSTRGGKHTLEAPTANPMIVGYIISCCFNIFNVFVSISWFTLSLCVSCHFFNGSNRSFCGFIDAQSS